MPDYLTDEDLNKMRAIRDAQRPLARSALLFAALLLLLSGDSALAQTRNDFVYWDEVEVLMKAAGQVDGIG